MRFLRRNVLTVVVPGIVATIAQALADILDSDDDGMVVVIDCLMAIIILMMDCFSINFAARKIPSILSVKMIDDNWLNVHEPLSEMFAFFITLSETEPLSRCFI
jgi:hypothetical protein